MNRIDLEGRFAVVTGGAQGIGLAVTERLLGSGAAVALWDRDPAQLVESEAALRSAGRTLAVEVDVTDAAAVDAAAQRTVDAFGKIDILVNNAGIAGPSLKSWEYPLDEWQRVMDIDLNGVFYCCRSVVPRMRERNYGRIVNVASIAGKEGNPNARPLQRRQGRGHRAHQVHREGDRRPRHRGQLHHPPPRPAPGFSTRSARSTSTTCSPRSRAAAS